MKNTIVLLAALVGTLPSFCYADEIHEAFSDTVRGENLDDCNRKLEGAVKQWIRENPEYSFINARGECYSPQPQFGRFEGNKVIRYSRPSEKKSTLQFPK